MQRIPKGTTADELARIPFKLVDATDLKTPEDITVTGVKVNLSIAGAADAPSANDIVKVDGAAGEYYIQLDATERDAPICSYIRGWLTPSGCAETVIEAQIDSVAAENEPASVATINAAIEAGAVGAGVTAANAALGALATALAAVQADVDAIIAAVANVDGDVSAVGVLASAIKTKTDLMVFGVTNALNTNVTYMNEAAVTGTGVPGDKWRGGA